MSLVWQLPRRLPEANVLTGHESQGSSGDIVYPAGQVEHSETKEAHMRGNCFASSPRNAGAIYGSAIYDKVLNPAYPCGPCGRLARSCLTRNENGCSFRCLPLNLKHTSAVNTVYEKPMSMCTFVPRRDSTKQHCRHSTACVRVCVRGRDY